MVGLKAFGKLFEISSTLRSSTFEFIDPPLAPHLTKAKGPARFMYKLFNEPNTIKYEYRYLTEKLQTSVFIFSPGKPVQYTQYYTLVYDSRIQQ